jgi:F-type H+-transporting ATPase subunit 6
VATDPIQKLFIDKIHDYAQKSKSTGGKLVDASPSTEKALTDELEKIARQYGAKGPDFLKFPTFAFTDPDLEPVGVQVEAKPQVAVDAELMQESLKDEDEDKLFWEP